MRTRRHTLQLAAGALAATAGCLGSPGGPDGEGVGDAPTRTPGDLPTWTPEWTTTFDDWHVLGLDVAGGVVYATLNTEGGPSAVAAVDPDDGSVLWRTRAEGEAVGGSHVAHQGVARNQWGVTPVDDAVYAVAGRAEEREWSALHALDPTTGERRWSLQRDRRLVVAGVVDGLLVATGLEFFPPPGTVPHSHQTPAEPLSTVVYGVDAATGEVRWSRTFDGVEDVAVGPDATAVALADRLVALDRSGSTTVTYDRGPGTAVAATAGRIYYLTGEDAGATLHGVSPGRGGDWTRSLPVGELLLDGDRLFAGGDAVVAVQPDGTVDWRDDRYGQWLLIDPDGDTLYTRTGIAADRARAYDVSGAARWTFSPPSRNAWPEAATDDALVATAITDGPSRTVYAVDGDGRATAAMGAGTVFDAVGLDGTVYLADGDSNLLALDP